MNTVTVSATKADWSKAEFSLDIDGKPYAFKHQASRILTATNGEYSEGIFARDYSEVEFTRSDTSVWVDFGDVWDFAKYPDPALEIQRRVLLVRAAFEAVRESYEKSWTVTI